MKRGNDGRTARVGLILLACLAVLLFWEFMAWRSERPWAAFDLSGADFADFSPRAPGWTARRVSAQFTDYEPNILAFRVCRESTNDDDPARGFALVRLVHGYNMPDCMRIKGYKVGLTGKSGMQEADSRTPSDVVNSQFTALPCQVWCLTDSIGRVSVWATAMLKAEDFEGTDTDIREMPFPRIDTPDNPDWVPRGVTVDGLKRPVASLRAYLKAKWNNSRCDLLTFLKLRQPAWASGDMLTLVAASQGESVAADEVESVSVRVCQALRFIHGELLRWKKDRRPD